MSDIDYTTPRVLHLGAFAELRDTYERLASAVVAAAGTRGFAGNDPTAALAWLTDGADDRILADAVLELWRTFFACFRADESAFEAARFQASATQIEARLAALAPEAVPARDLVVAMLAALSSLWHERHQTISQRLDTLISDLGQHQARLGTAELSAAHRADELERIQQVMQGACAELGMPPPADEPAGQAAVRLITRYRDDLAAARRQATGQVQALKRLMEAIRAIAAGQPSPALPPEAEALLADVRRLDATRRELEQGSRELHATVARLDAERAALVEKMAAADRHQSQLAAQPDPGGEVLGLYRQALATWEAGGDLKALAERIHRLERVITLPTVAAERAVQIADRHLTELATCLDQLHRIAPRGEDPKRYRPRLFGTRYEFKTLAGQITALRDAGHDLERHLERARWAQGVGILARQAPKLRSVFREMVSLVAHWRLKLGDPPPVSVSISIDGGSGIIALPAILASDLELMLRKKNRLGTAAAGLATVLDGCVAMYHKALEQAVGVAIERSAAGKRESAGQALIRLTNELAALAGRCENIYGEVSGSDFALAAADAALIADEHLLRMGLGALDGACVELAALPNAPLATLAALPARGKDLGLLVTAAHARTAWLDLIACYRVVTG